MLNFEVDFTVSALAASEFDHKELQLVVTSVLVTVVTSLPHHFKVHGAVPLGFHRP